MTHQKNRKKRLLFVRQLQVLCALYEDPKTGYPPKYARDGIPKIEKYDHPLFQVRVTVRVTVRESKVRSQPNMATIPSRLSLALGFSSFYFIYLI